MAAGAGGSSGDSLEATLDRKFQNVSNTMDSIQGLSTWCIDNKKYHSLIVRQWVKCVRKSESPHRLNLFYLANDVIQNCKRKNAIVYRTAFAEVLRDTFTLVNQDGDQKVIKSLERILSIWEDRGVYSGMLITELRSSLVKEESPVETPVEQKTPVESNAYLRSKIVAEFVPQALVDQLSKYKRSIEDVDLREKQLAAMRIDICNNETLKKLKDKAGGKKFSKDFEEGSAQLQEFIKFFNNQCKTGPPLLQALSNADIFYEMQYKEVKIVANAYQTFANRVSHLKRKLDALKATLPDLDDSPIPSPSADAPSPTGSESPFHDLELANADPDLDGSVMEDEAEPPAPSPLSTPGGSPRNPDTLWDRDNRMVEDMELSEEEVDGAGIIEEQRKDAGDPAASPPAPSAPAAAQPAVSTAAPTTAEPPSASEEPASPPTPSVSDSEETLDSVDLARIESILSSLSSAMKSSADSPPTNARPPPSLKTATAVSPAAPQDAGPLVNLLSKVDMSPADLLSALSKVQGLDSLDGISSLLSNSCTSDFSDSHAASAAPPAASSTVPSAASFQSQSSSSTTAVPPPSGSAARQSSPASPPQTSNPASALVQALHQDMDLTAEPEPSLLSESLESKIHNFLQGNSAFSAFDLGFHAPSLPGRDILSPVTGGDNQGGTPVRDEGGGTPTQDEIMDKPAAAAAKFSSTSNQTAAKLYQGSGPKNPNDPLQLQPGPTPNGQLGQQFLYGKHMSEQGAAAPVAHFQQLPAPVGGPVPGDRAPGLYPEGNSQRFGPYHLAPPRGADENKAPRPYTYQPEQTRQHQEPAAQQGANPSFAFLGGLPPVPNLPPPPQDFENPPHAAGGRMMPQEQPLRPDADAMSGAGMDSVIRGMVVHDHQHKSVFRSEESVPAQYDGAEQPRPDERHYQDDSDYFPDEHGYRDEQFFPGDSSSFPPHPHQDEAYQGPGSPPRHFPRVRGRLPGPPPPPDDPYFAQDFQWRGPRPPRFPLRRAPPHPDMRPPRPRPPHRPPFPPQHLQHPPPHPRGPPPPPFARFQGPDFRMRLKRPDPRGMGPPGPMFGPKRPFLPPRY